MDLGIAHKKALITGAGRGLGEVIARSLASEGVKVAVVSRTQKDLERLLDTIGGRRKGHFALASDLTQEGAPARVLKTVQKQFGPPDIVVNNLGDTLDIRDPYCTIADWRRIWRINLEVAIEINNIVIPEMKKKKWGRIVHNASIAALENQGPVPYCSAKAAVTAYVRSMGRILAPDGIIMTSILPGAVYTKGGYWDMASKTKIDHVKKYLAERMAIHRFGKPEEIGAVVAFLCSVHASFMVGSMVPVDGGQGRVFFRQDI